MKAIVKDIKKFLNSDDKKILDCYLKGFTLGEIVKLLKISRQELLHRFILLGRAFAFYFLFNCILEPKCRDSSYLQGFKAAEKQMREGLKHEYIKIRKNQKKKSCKTVSIDF